MAKTVVEQFEEERQRALEEDERDFRLLARDFQDVFNKTTQGRRVRDFLLEETGVFSWAFHGNSRDALNAGRRYIGMLVLHMLDINSIDSLEETFRTKYMELQQRLKDIEPEEHEPEDVFD